MPSTFNTSETIRLLLPEIILAAMAMAIYVAATFQGGRNREAWSLVAVATYAGAALILLMQSGSTVQVGASKGTAWQLWAGGLSSSTGPLVIDFLAYGFRWLALVLGVLFTLTVSRLADRESAGEFIATLMLLVVGMMLVSSANELVLLFVALELISIPTYVLLFLGRRDRASSEATAKYFFLSVFSSAILLYGFSFLYGLTGTTNLAELWQRAGTSLVGAPTNSLFPLIATVLIFAGIGFKIAAVPFHFYAPDVYQGTTSANAGILSVAPKVAGIVVLIRLSLVLQPFAADFVWQLSMALAVFTMTIGNVCALWQNNVRRLLAYSSIAHAGYLLIGLAAGLAASQSHGIAATLLYVFVYSLATFGAFAALAHLGSERTEVNNVDDLAGLGRRRPAAAAALAVFMFALAGIPPLAGFWGKLTLFTSAVSAAQYSTAAVSTWFVVLAVAGAVNTAVAAAYYLRIVSVMYFRPPVGALPAKGGSGAWVVMIGCALLVVIVGVAPNRVVQYSEMAEGALLKPTTQPAAAVQDKVVPPAIRTASSLPTQE